MAGFGFELVELAAQERQARTGIARDDRQFGGLGRTGHLFAYEGTGVVPDMVTLAKPLAGGLPMGAVLMTDAIGASMHPGDHGTTFGGGPFVASVAMHVVERLADPAMLAHVRTTGAWFGNELRALAERKPNVRAVRGVGYIWGVDVAEPAAGIVARALEAALTGSMLAWTFHRQGTLASWLRRDLRTVIAPYEA